MECETPREGRGGTQGQHINREARYTMLNISRGELRETVRVLSAARAVSTLAHALALCLFVHSSELTTWD